MHCLITRGECDQPANAPGPPSVHGTGGGRYVRLPAVEPRDQSPRALAAGSRRDHHSPRAPEGRVAPHHLPQSPHALPRAAQVGAGHERGGGTVYPGDPQSQPGGAADLSGLRTFVRLLSMAPHRRHAPHGEARPGATREEHRSSGQEALSEQARARYAILHNRGNHCYANSIFPSLKHFCEQACVDLVPPASCTRESLYTVFRGSPGQSLVDCPFWPVSFDQWPLEVQQDAAEFLHIASKHLVQPAFF